MQVPERLGDCAVIYYVPLPEPDSDAHAVALVACPVGGSYARKTGKQLPTVLLMVDIDRDGEPMWETDLWYESAADFERDVKRWWGEVALYRPGDETPGN